MLCYSPVLLAHCFQYLLCTSGLSLLHRPASVFLDFLEPVTRVVIPDPRWLQILKASGWQLAGLAVAFGIFLMLPTWGLMPPLPAWAMQLAALAFLVTAGLALASLLSNTFTFFPVQKWFLTWYNLGRAKRRVRDYIPHMNKQERDTIAYLLAKNEKMFKADSDGGYASTLLSRGIIRVAAKPGQHIDLLDTPMEVPDYVWDVLVKHKDQFPYTPQLGQGDVERKPWRVPRI